MAKKTSQRERIQRLALEAELGAKEKSEKKTATSKTASPKAATAKTATAKAASPKPKKARPSAAADKSANRSGRQKVVWQVCDPRSKIVATFAYPEQKAAEARAAQLSEKHGEEYRVRSAKVPLD